MFTRPTSDEIFSVIKCDRQTTLMVAFTSRRTNEVRCAKMAFTQVISNKRTVDSRNLSMRTREPGLLSIPEEANISESQRLMFTPDSCLLKPVFVSSRYTAGQYCVSKWHDNHRQREKGVAYVSQPRFNQLSLSYYRSGRSQTRHYFSVIYYYLFIALSRPVVDTNNKERAAT